MSLQQNLSNFMNTIRLSRNQSITEFAEEIGVSRSEMQHILKGTCNPRIDTLKSVSYTHLSSSAILFFFRKSPAEIKPVIYRPTSVSQIKHRRQCP